MIKYFFSDLDGTLYVNDDVYHKDVKAIHKFVNGGGVFAVATGRSDWEIVNFANEELLPEPRFRVSTNGTMVMDGEQELFRATFSQAAKVFILDYLNAHSQEFSTVEFNTPELIYFINEPEDWILNYKGERYEIHTQILQAFYANDFEILKFFIEGNKLFIDELIALIAKHFPNDFEVFNDGTAVNINPKTVDKGIGIQHLMSKYNIKPEEIAVIGDAANDLGMFAITPNSFTFTYAADFIKAKANYVVANVAEAIQLILDKKI